MIYPSAYMKWVFASSSACVLVNVLVRWLVQYPAVHSNVLFRDRNSTTSGQNAVYHRACATPCRVPAYLMLIWFIFGPVTSQFVVNFCQLLQNNLSYHFSSMFELHVLSFKMVSRVNRLCWLINIHKCDYLLRNLVQNTDWSGKRSLLWANTLRSACVLRLLALWDFNEGYKCTGFKTHRTELFWRRSKVVSLLTTVSCFSSQIMMDEPL